MKAIVYVKDGFWKKFVLLWSFMQSKVVMALEKQIEDQFIRYLSENLKYVYRPDINDRDSLERNFREKFQALNRCHLTDNEFARLLEEITDADVFNASKLLRERNTFMREDGTPLQYSLVNIKDWCKNDYEVILRAVRCSRLSITRTMSAMATPTRCCASCRCSLSATSTIPTILPTTIRNISTSMQRRNICLFISGLMRRTRKSQAWMPFRMFSCKSAVWAR